MIFCISIFCTMDMYLYQLELLYFGHDSLGFCTCTYILSIPLLMFMIFEYHFNAIYVYPRQCMYGDVDRPFGPYPSVGGIRELTLFCRSDAFASLLKKFTE